MESKKMHVTTVTNEGVKYISQEWWINRGKYHREDGPAVIEYDENGKIIVEEYYLNGREMNKLQVAVIEATKKNSTNF